MAFNMFATGRFQVTRLDGSNYGTWAQKCGFLLCKEGLWTVVNDPPNIEALDAANDEDAKVIAKFQTDNEKALCIIDLMLGDTQLVHIHGLESAADCWKKLRTIYVRDSVGAHIYLTRKLFREHLTPGGDMLKHLEFMKKKFFELHEKELMYNEQQQVYILLSSLDDRYDQFVSSLQGWPKEKLTLDNVIGHLLEETRSRQDSEIERL